MKKRALCLIRLLIGVIISAFAALGINAEAYGNITIESITEKPKENYVISSYDVREDGYVIICSDMCEPFEKLQSVICIYNEKMEFICGIRYKSNESTGALWIDGKPAIYKFASKEIVVFNEKWQITNVESRDCSVYVDSQSKRSSTSSYYCSNSKEPRKSLGRGNMVSYKYLIKTSDSSSEIIYTGSIVIKWYYIAGAVIIISLAFVMVFCTVRKCKKIRQNVDKKGDVSA